MNDTSPVFVVIMLSWTFFLVYWFIESFRVKPTIERESRVSRGIVAILVGGGFYLVFSSKGYPLLSERIIPHDPFLDGLAIAVDIIGLGICIWARRILAGNWSASVTFKEGHELIQRGPYRFVRHPIYTGFLLMMLGAVIAEGRVGPMTGLVLAVLGFWYKLLQEEQLMIRHFPDVYPRYKTQVNALIPWFGKSR